MDASQYLASARAAFSRCKGFRCVRLRLEENELRERDFPRLVLLIVPVPHKVVDLILGQARRPVQSLIQFAFQAQRAHLLREPLL